MRIGIIILLACLSQTAIAQTNGYAGYIRIGSINISDAKTVLGEMIPGITGFKSSFFGVGGELEYKSNKAILDGEIMILSHGPVNNGASHAEPFTGAMLIKAGYVVFEKRNVFAYPTVGAGVAGMFVNTYTKTGDVKDQLHTIYLLQPAIDLGLNINYILYRFKNTMPTGTLPVGIRTGFRISPGSDNWKRIAETDLEKHTFSISGWHISIALGMGYLSPRNKK